MLTNGQDKHKKSKSFLIYTDNRLGPGYYDPNLDTHLRTAPKIRIPQEKRVSELSPKPEKEMTISDLYSIQEGNMAQKVKHNKKFIENFLGNTVKGKDGRTIKINSGRDFSMDSLS